MTEPNDTPGTDPDGGEEHPIWPAPPAHPRDATGIAPSGDPAVAALLDRLGGLPVLPVALQWEAYAVLHDDLLAALNEDVASAAGTTTQTEDPTHEQA